jgi:pimeloyl-ACP methyl ester carboxylesterase
VVGRLKGNGQSLIMTKKKVRAQTPVCGNIDSYRFMEIVVQPSRDVDWQPSSGTVSCPDAAALTGGARQMRYLQWQAPDCTTPDHVVVCVHGLTRNGRDFDVLARQLAKTCTVIAVDVAGRGQSDWLANPDLYGVPLYVADHIHLLRHLHDKLSPRIIDWVGTSMGGLIGMGVASLPVAVLPMPIRRMVLNDVGPTLEFDALRRIGTYVGKSTSFPTVQAGADALWQVCKGFGPHTPEQWLALSAPMLNEQDGHYVAHYDPAIGLAFQSFDRPDAAALVEKGNQALWHAYDAITAQTLVIRGEESDLLTATTLTAMTQRGPRAKTYTVSGVGHAPTLIAADQREVVADFLLT